VIKSVLIFNNEAKEFSHGAGPIAIKTLLDINVEIIGLHDVGVGSGELLNEKSIRYFKLRSGIRVLAGLEAILKKIYKE